MIRIEKVASSLVLLVLAVAVLGVTGCAPKPSGETGTEIMEAGDLAGFLEQPGTVVVDARPFPEYREGHVSGAVNVSRADIVVLQPFPNLVAPAEQIERVLGSRGIGNDTLVIAYDDNNNMDAARLWWTLKAYGHDKVKVVSGGLEALKREGYALETGTPSVQSVSFSAGPLDESMIISTAEIRRYLNEPEDTVVLLDTRTEEEHLEGHIPGSILVDYANNNFRDGTFRPVNHIRIMYLEKGIDYSKEVIMYCKTSIRGAQTYLALYNAGYRNLRLYDGAWVEWTSNPLNPVYVPDTGTQLRAPDMS
jgi:thiosulfate/3-mercaptopyruvate sulfurtransferase